MSPLSCPMHLLYCAGPLRAFVSRVPVEDADSNFHIAQRVILNFIEPRMIPFGGVGICAWGNIRCSSCVSVMTVSLVALKQTVLQLCRSCAGNSTSPELSSGQGASIAVFNSAWVDWRVEFALSVHIIMSQWCCIGVPLERDHHTVTVRKFWTDFSQCLIVFRVDTTNSIFCRVLQGL
jgi:hypothetical protein